MGLPEPTAIRFRRLPFIIQERCQPKIINGSRRKRIAVGSGRPIQEVNKLIKEFFQITKMMKQMSKKAFPQMRMKKSGLHLRLKRLGRRNKPFYRIIVIDSRKRRDGSAIEEVGWYDPISKKDKNFILEEDRILHWLSQGAQPTDIVKNMMKKTGLSHRWHLMRLGLSDDEIERNMQKWKLDRESTLKQREEKELEKSVLKKKEAEKEKEVEEEVKVSIESEDSEEESIGGSDDESSKDEETDEVEETSDDTSEEDDESTEETDAVDTNKSDSP
jgi:small subunit ribosomal protein S16